MNGIQVLEQQQTFNATDIRFRLGQILNELARKRKPILIINRSKPRAWLCPYENITAEEDLFIKWEKEALPRYRRIKAKDLINLIRKDRERL